MGSMQNKKRNKQENKMKWLGLSDEKQIKVGLMQHKIRWEPCYNEDLWTMKITLLYLGKTKKSLDQQITLL